jgi:hypothetical protein
MTSTPDETLDMRIDYLAVGAVHLVRSPISVSAYYPLGAPPSAEAWERALAVLQEWGVDASQLAYDECQVSLAGGPERTWAGVTSAGLHLPHDDGSVLPTLGNIPAHVTYTPTELSMSFTVNGTLVKVTRAQETGGTGYAQPAAAFPATATNMRVFTLAFPGVDSAEEFLPVIEEWRAGMPEVLWHDGVLITGREFTSLRGTSYLRSAEEQPVFTSADVKFTLDRLESRGYASGIKIAMSWHVFTAHDLAVQTLGGVVSEYWVAAVRGRVPDSAATPPALPQARGYRCGSYVFPDKRHATRYVDTLRQWAQEQRAHISISEIVAVDAHGRWQEFDGTDPDAANLITTEHIDRAEQALREKQNNSDDVTLTAVLVGQYWPEWKSVDVEFVQRGGRILEYALRNVPGVTG